MTMIREFFDITMDSREIFEGLAIMDTEYVSQINSRPVIFLTLKDCKAATASDLLELLKLEIYSEYLRYEKQLGGKLDKNSFEYMDFYKMIDTLRNPEASAVSFVSALQDLTRIARTFYQIAPILLIDEYDQPIMSSYEFGYHDKVSTFFSNFYGKALKGNARACSEQSPSVYPHNPP